MNFDKYFKGDKEAWTAEGTSLNGSLIVQTKGHGGLATVFGTGKKAEANMKLILQAHPMAEFIFDMVMARKDKGEDTLSMQEKFEMQEGERILKLILK